MLSWSIGRGQRVQRAVSSSYSLTCFSQVGELLVDGLCLCSQAAEKQGHQLGHSEERQCMKEPGGGVKQRDHRQVLKPDSPGFKS